MATSAQPSRRAPVRPRQQRLPTWVLVILFALLVVLVYGMLRPKTPNAFDRPDAQVNPSVAPWSQPTRAY
ncbi:MAG: hypothetical protein ACREFQ_12650 [Stellaceae bacterium]